MKKLATDMLIFTGGVLVVSCFWLSDGCQGRGAPAPVERRGRPRLPRERDLRGEWVVLWGKTPCHMSLGDGYRCDWGGTLWVGNWCVAPRSSLCPGCFVITESQRPGDPGAWSTYIFRLVRQPDGHWLGREVVSGLRIELWRKK